MAGSRKNKLLQQRVFISNTTSHSNILQAEQNIVICRWRSDQLFAINDLRDSDNHSITKFAFICKSLSDS